MNLVRKRLESTPKDNPAEKELRLIDVYAIATGTTLGAGLFLLPGLAAKIAGPALIIAYLIAAIPLIPALFSMIELSTAMPRAGGIYYFLDRTLGPAFGTVGGIGTWLALMLKVSFALIGMGAYINLFYPEAPIDTVAVALAILLGIVNIFGAKSSGRLQVVLVTILLAILGFYLYKGFGSIDPANFNGFFDAGFTNILNTSGLVFVSYIGLTKIASVSEEIKKPERNIPLGIMLALLTSIIMYIAATTIMVGSIPMERLAGDFTPVATSADAFMGKFGIIVVSIAALMAFTSVANAGIMSASRYPLAMSRDHVMSPIFQRLVKHSIPLVSIVTTVVIIIGIVLFLNPTRIAKLASAFQLILFALSSVAVIVMRESKIAAYDPGFKSPLYPWMQIFGILTALILIAQMGIVPILFSSALILVSFLWYYYYAKSRVTRAGAIYHVFERLGKQRHEGLDHELRGILKEKGLREGDPFDEIVARSKVFDFDNDTNFEQVTDIVSGWLSKVLNLSAKEIKEKFMEGTRIGATPVTHGVALPHFRVDNLEQAEMVLVRNRNGIQICFNDPLSNHEQETKTINSIIFLISPENDPTQHLRILAQIASRIDEEAFHDDWIKAHDEQDLKEVLLRDERFLSLTISSYGKGESMVDRPLREMKIPDGCLIALLRRNGYTLVPKGYTVFEENDRLTIIGDPKGLKEIAKRYGGEY